MAADSTHPIYEDCVEAWQMVRDCICGSRKIKAAGEDYLPRLHQQDDPDYDAYKTRATFFNALKRTLQAFVGFIFRNNPEVIMPDQAESLMADFMKDSTMTGKSFYDVSKDTVRAMLSVGKRGTIIDWQLIPENRPFLITYEPEDILNWKFKRIQGQTILGLIVFREMSSEWISLKAGEPEPDAWEHAQYEQLREYEVLEDEAGRPYVQVTVRRKKFGDTETGGKKKKANTVPAEWVIVDQKIPVRRARPLTRIPFVPHGAEANDLDSEEIPLEPIADINVGHYRNSADFENALHVCGHPTPIACGFGGDEDADEEFYLGGKAWVTDKVDAKADFLAYDASMAAPLVDAMKEKKEEMAALGARMLEKQGSSGGGHEAFQTVQVRQSGDHSALMSATIAGSQSLSDVLQWVYWWIDPSIAQPEDLDETIKTELNTKFVQMLMESTMLSAVWNVYMQGGMSYETLFRNLQDGGIISSERKMEDEIEAIQNDPVRLVELDRQAKAEEAVVAAAAAAKKPPGEGDGAGNGA